MSARSCKVIETGKPICGIEATWVHLWIEEAPGPLLGHLCYGYRCEKHRKGNDEPVDSGKPLGDWRWERNAEPVCWEVTCEAGHVGYFPSVYTTLCDRSCEPVDDENGEPEDRCMAPRTAVALYRHPPTEEAS